MCSSVTRLIMITIEYKVRKDKTTNRDIKM
jgi:hypothetical protein